MRRMLASVVAVLLACVPAFAHLFPPAYDDAPLRAVQFVDAREGWAVGDHGVVWHSIDGGKTWERQKTGSKASLRCVRFIDPYTGWAVGRTELPNGGGSCGVVLSTADGGLTWTEVSAAATPGLNWAKFFDEKTGIAAGDGSDAAPSGLFVTGDAGKTWLALPGPRATSWLGGEFTNLSTGTLGGVWSRLSVVRGGKPKAADFDPIGGRAIRGVAFNGQNGVAVGDGGTVLTTANGGGTWAVADTGLSADAAACLDLHCVAMSGDTVWAAGCPGSVVLKSADAGKTWQTIKTKWATPILSLCAISESEAWAVGELGAILKTTDGGKTWAVQKCGGQRAAVMFAHADGRSLPADAMGIVGGRDGYLAAAVSLTSADPATADPKRSLDEFALAAAVRAAGGAGCGGGWAFPVPSHLADGSAESLTAAWEKLHGGNSEHALVRRLVLAMRMWQPEVVVSDLLASSAGPADRLVLAAAKTAFKLADDPTAYPEQLEVLGLSAASPKKLYALCLNTATDCPVKYDLTEFARTLGDTTQNYAEPALAILGQPALLRRQFRLVSHRMPGSEVHAELTNGLDLTEGGPARRKAPPLDASVNDLFKKLEGIVRTRRTIEGLTLSADTATATEKALPTVLDSLKGMPDDIACRTAVAVGRQLAAQGRWVAAREMFVLVAARYAAFPESAEAVRWLCRYYTSGETRRRADLENMVTLQYATNRPVGGDGVKQASHAEVATAKRQFVMSDAEAAQLWCKACLELEPKMAAHGAVYAADPGLALSTLSARRQLGLTGDAAKQVAAYFKNTPGAADLAPGTDLWRDCLAAELWLTNRTAVPVQPKPLAMCPRATAKPFLDGKLDDECWTAFKPIELKNAAGEMKGHATRAHFAYDDEFVYFAIECTHPAHAAAVRPGQRRRDEDLRGQDRVDILLDLDRDYQTYYRLQIDSRGCVAEDCWGDASWNPKWFVAVDSTETGWTAEVAIPRAELTGCTAASGAVWGMNVTRVVPGVGCQSWSGPASATPRAEGVGLMQFAAETKK